ncbi:GNAT family N-acetyltransferase [Luteimonas sp. 3794]|uniref:GNAT family N-acetyltransferase n=1 Tax=Luteimonas sp. 3794 TaxID=2817730 RepID=UPI00285E9C28|nr:GNAT family N-acetyltransferase [Luteimonas sp. 3794]MDR6991134.1 putative GNAT family N-acyltransferase [Luteimonas sp. 3794]
MSAAAPFRVALVTDAGGLAAAHAVRTTVFVTEQGVPADLERDALDALSRHVLATATDGTPIGAGRIAPDGRIGRLAVRSDWRGRGVGEAMLRALLDAARNDGLRATYLHAQLQAMGLYARAGFVAEAAPYEEAGIAHRTMRRVAGATFPVDDLAAAVDTTVTVIAAARRTLSLRTRALDPGLYDHPDVLGALRRFATAGRSVQIQILLHDPATLQRRGSAVLALSQRLSSAFAFRAVIDPVDREYAGAFLVNDAGGFHVRPLGYRVDGEAATDLPGRARQLAQQFAPVWERSRACSEFRALGI